MTSNTLTSYTESIIKSGTPILGFLTWYSVPESVLVDYDDLKTALDGAGLSANMKRPPKDSDVFKRVASAHQRKNVPTTNPDIYENYLVRKVSDGVPVVRQIVVEQVNPAGKKLSHEACVQIEFRNDPNGVANVTFGWINGSLNDQALAVAELIRNDYLNERGKVNAYGIRELLRAIVLGAGATIVRKTGGVYFFKAAAQPTIDSLGKLAAAIPGVDVHPVPLPDDKNQREMLRAAVEEDTMARFDEIVTKLNTTDTMSLKQYQALTVQAQSLTDHLTEYAALLDSTLASTELKLKVTQRRLADYYKSGQVQ